MLQRRDNKKNIPFPNKLGTFGGQIEDNECPEEAMKRELMEELEGYNTEGIIFWKIF